MKSNEGKERCEMAVLKVFNFDAEAEILGSVKQVRFNGGRLQLDNLSLEEAFSCLEKLSTGQLAAVKPGISRDLLKGKLGGQEEPIPPAIVEAVAAKMEEIAKELEAQGPAQLPVAVAESPKPEKPAAKAKREKATVVAEPKAEKVAEPPAPEVKTAELPPPSPPLVTVPEPQPMPPQAEPRSDVPLAISGATRLRDILTALRADGISGEAELIAECARLKAAGASPLLSRIPSIPERVSRTLAVMDGELQASTA